jgi:hypothetical protein
MWLSLSDAAGVVAMSRDCDLDERKVVRTTVSGSLNRRKN